MTDLTTRLDVACTADDVDPGVFFPLRPTALDEARAICAACPEQAACRALARDVAAQMGAQKHGLQGVWGGELWRYGEIIDNVPVRGRRKADA